MSDLLWLAKVAALVWVAGAVSGLWAIVRHGSLDDWPWTDRLLAAMIWPLCAFAPRAALRLLGHPRVDEP